MSKSIFLISCLLAFFCCSSKIVHAGEQNRKIETENYLELQSDFYIPDNKSEQKFPVIFLAHNGGSNKDAWGDFPEFLAQKGYFVVNFTWNSNMIKTNLEVESIVQYTFKKYSSIADSSKVAFIGGCRGGANMIAQLSRLNKIPCKVKTVVALCVTENSTYTDMINGMQTTHVPVLAFYCTQNRYGAKYQALSKEFAEELLTQPKNIVVLDASPHGHELVNDTSTKSQVRNNIIAWLAKNVNN